MLCSPPISVKGQLYAVLLISCLFRYRREWSRGQAKVQPPSPPPPPLPPPPSELIIIQTLEHPFDEVAHGPRQPLRDLVHHAHRLMNHAIHIVEQVVDHISRTHPRAHAEYAVIDPALLPSTLAIRLVTTKATTTSQSQLDKSSLFVSSHDEKPPPINFTGSKIHTSTVQSLPPAPHHTNHHNHL